MTKSAWRDYVESAPLSGDKNVTAMLAVAKAIYELVDAVKERNEIERERDNYEPPKTSGFQYI